MSAAKKLAAAMTAPEAQSVRMPDGRVITRADIEALKAETARIEATIPEAVRRALAASAAQIAEAEQTARAARAVRTRSNPGFAAVSGDLTSKFSALK